MADDITATSTTPAGVPDSTKFVTDEHATRGHMFLMKLAYSADGDATPVTADGNGLEVNVTNASFAVTDGGVTLSVDDGGGALTVDGTVAVSGTVTVDSELPAGAALADNTANPTTPSVGTFPHLFDGSTWDRAPGTSADGALVNLGSNNDVVVAPRSTGGLSMFRSIDIDETEEEVKASAGNVYGWYIFNASASTRYVKFYNATAANVTVGTTTPVLTLPVPAGGAANVFSSIGISFGTAITVAATTGVADNDTGAPSANDVIINVLYT